MLPKPILLIVCPHTQHIDLPRRFIHPVDQTVLQINAAGVGACQLAHQLFIWRRVLPRVGAQHVQQRLGFRFEASCRQVFRIFSGGFAKSESPNTRLTNQAQTL